MEQKLIIGRVDYADFPLLQLSQIPVKIDTGAYGCSLHCDHIEEKSTNLQSFLELKLSNPEAQNQEPIIFKTTQYWTKNVKSSSGISEERFFISTQLRLFSTLFTIKLSLTDRSEMKYPVLLGRRLLSKNFLVDTSKTFLSHKKMQARL